MANSPLVSYTKLSTNHSGRRVCQISRITPHAVVGQLSVESICNCFKDRSRQASCNYAIGEGIGTSLSGGTFSEGFDFARERTKREAEETAKIYKATIAGIEKDITESQNRIAAERKRIAEMSRTARGVPHQETTTSVPSPSNAPLI